LSIKNLSKLTCFTSYVQTVRCFTTDLRFKI